MTPPPLRQPLATGGPTNAGIAPLNVAAFGDSVMWGQGLPRNARFTQLFMDDVGRQLNTPMHLMWDKSRSGAKILASPGDREEFIKTYPTLFANSRSREAFRDATDESPAEALYGEVPAPLPSIIGQVRMLAAQGQLGTSIHIALVDGGVNDIEVEDVIDARVSQGAWIERFDGQIRLLAQQQVDGLLREVRRTCPNAVILYFGFFKSLSTASDRSKVRAFLKHEYNDDVMWWFNQHVYQVVDVGALITEAVARAGWFQGRFTYWIRQVIDALASDENLRGPGVLFVPSGFSDVNAAFAAQSGLHEDYTVPTSDPAVTTRVANIPRIGAYKQAEKLVAGLLTGGKPQARALQKAINGQGPEALERELAAFLAGQDGAKDRLWEEAVAFLHLLRHGQVASMAHPNTSGAKLYAHQAVRAYTDWEATKAQVATETAPGFTAAAGHPTVEGTLNRYQMRRGGRSVLADAGMLDVHSIAIRVRTSEGSSRNVVLPLYLHVAIERRGGVVRTASFPLTPRYHREQLPPPMNALQKLIKPYPWLEPGKVNRFTVDTEETLKLDRIKGCYLHLGPDPAANLPDDLRRKLYGYQWKPESVIMEVNGREVVDLGNVAGTTLRSGSTLDLRYPSPLPPITPPTLPDGG